MQGCVPYVIGKADMRRTCVGHEAHCNTHGTHEAKGSGL